MSARAPDGPSAAAGLANVRIVLVRPRGSANVGAAARAMKNMGIRDLTLVRPAVRRYAAADAMAVHARDVVRRARIAADLGAAVGDCHLVVGTTCRTGGYRTAVEPIEGLAPQMVSAAQRGPVAIVFGPEDHGLTNADLRHCQRMLRLDTDPSYASLNLAQAVLLVCDALRRAAHRGAPPARAVTPAPAAAVQRMYETLQAALLSIGFLHPQNPEHLMFALRRMFGRVELEEAEVRIMLGIARQIRWFAATHGGAERSQPPSGAARRLPDDAPAARRPPRAGRPRASMGPEPIDRAARATRHG